MTGGIITQVYKLKDTLQKQTDIVKILDAARRALKRKSLICVFLDFLDYCLEDVTCRGHLIQLLRSNIEYYVNARTRALVSELLREEESEDIVSEIERRLKELESKARVVE